MSCVACKHFRNINTHCKRGVYVNNTSRSIGCRMFELDDEFKKLGEKDGGCE